MNRPITTYINGVITGAQGFKQPTLAGSFCLRAQQFSIF